MEKDKNRNKIIHVVCDEQTFETISRLAEGCGATSSSYVKTMLGIIIGQTYGITLHGEPIKNQEN
jgi:hypothetical protein